MHPLLLHLGERGTAAVGIAATLAKYSLLASPALTLQRVYLAAAASARRTPRPRARPSWARDDPSPSPPHTSPPPLSFSGRWVPSRRSLSPRSRR